MSKFNRIALSVIIFIVCAFAFIFIYGLAIGGINAPFFITAVVFSLLIIAVIGIIVYGKDFYKDRLQRGMCLGLACLFIGAVYIGYVFFNKALADTENAREYTTVCVDYQHYRRGSDIYFVDRNGKYVDYDTHYFNMLVASKGSELLVRETDGGFGFVIYDIIQIDGEDVE